MIGDTFDFFPSGYEHARSMGCYRAYCVRVVDGDTYDLIFDLGVTVRVKVRVRLKDFDTPEFFHPSNDAERAHAAAAIAFISDLLLDKPCLVRTFRTKMGGDVTTVGRYVADIYYRTDSGEWRDIKLPLDQAKMRKRGSYV